MNKAVIFDIDGTLADISHRLHYIQGEKKDYNSFYESCVCGDFRDQSQNERVFSLLHSRIKSNVEHGISTVVDATNLRNRDRKAIRDVVPKGTLIEYIVIDRPLEDKLATNNGKNYCLYDYMDCYNFSVINANNCNN